MGGSRWSDDDYYVKSTSRASLSVDKTTFAYTADVNAGRAPAVAHPTLDPSALKADSKVRESRDSKEHPNSNAIVVQLDGTGSMGSVIRTIHSKLPTLMGLLLRKNYIEDPQILFMMVGDATCDKVPLQVGQFESGVEMDSDLGNMLIEGGGGGQQTESYELGMFVGARKTSIDCFEKRGRKGYYFIIGDEMAYASVNKNEVKDVIGADLEAHIPTKKIVAELKEKYNVFFILPAHASNGRDNSIKGYWKELVGAEQVLVLEDEKNVAELIATQIALCEGTADVDAVKADLKDAGVSASTALAVVNSVSSAYKGGAITKVAAGALEPSSGGGADRL